MSEPTIAQKSPVPVEVEAGKDYWWCSCGKSKNQPFFCGCRPVCKEKMNFWTCDQVRTFVRPVCATDKGRWPGW